MDTRYHISQVLDQAFGVRSPRFITPSLGFLNRPRFKLFEPDIKLEEFVETKQSWLGTPIVMPLYFLGGSNLKMFNERGEVVENRFGDFELPAATLIDFTREKLSEETQVSGGYGTVKEVYGFGDWNITIRGVCLDEPGIRSALDQKRALLIWERVVESIKVAGVIFDDVLVFNLFIKKITIRELEGQPSTIPFEMECLSDEPIELEL